MDILKNIKDSSEKTREVIQKAQFNFLNMSKLSRLNPKISKEKIGKSPGTLIYTGKPRTEKVKIQVMDYTKLKVNEFETENVEEIFKFRDKDSTTWINITGVHNLEIIKKIGEHFRLHKLLLEDVVNINQRPKIEDFDSDIFFVLKMITRNDSEHKIDVEQISLILGKNFVISFQEKEGDVFEPVRKRIRDGKTKIRELKSDYLTYALIDILIDNYFVVLEQIGEEIELIESNLIQNPAPLTQNNIYKLKRELILLRKSVWPLREVISGLQRQESKLVTRYTQTYIRDLYDHTIQLIDTIETFRDMLSGMLDLYMTTISNKMNEVMKVLTIIATIFIPLTFLAGIYGMNFEYMPELGYKGAYFILLGFMILAAGIMILYFKIKKWM